MPAIVNLLFNTISTNTTIAFTLVLPLVSVLSLLVGVGGHMLLWLVLMRNPRRRSKPSSVLLLNLSLADLGALLTLPCVILSASSQDWQLGGTTCVLLGFMTSLTAGVDIFSLAALSVLRHRIVALPTRAPTTPTHVAVTITLIWLVSVAMALPKVTYIEFSGGCTWSVERAQWLGFLVPAFLVYYVAPLLCIAVNCSSIVLRLHRCTGGRPSADRRNKKATALLVASTLAFAVSWLPYYALEFVNVTSPHVCSAASPIDPFGPSQCGPSNVTSSSPSWPPLPSSSWPQSSTSPIPEQEAETTVSLLWEVGSLTAILLVCLAPCWNPPLYFLLSRPAVRELQGLMPAWLRERLEGDGKASRRWRVAPASPPVLQPALRPPQSPPPQTRPPAPRTPLAHRLIQ
ncbi:somatostatin receptor type 3 [Gadus chalcogrammus]|uniref:somatostatin receptor type 3 n=1 Tax=Gadus chalcogrammus TaxID=1042646 RepID=UPI0024C49A36|nr:somatostatin receptor type 3 [Gadus chalcogrammus]